MEWPVKLKLTKDQIEKVYRLQQEGLSNNLIAIRIGVHPSTLAQALRKAALTKGNKFSAEAGEGFPSKLEGAVHQMLLLRERAKEIRNIQRQVRVELTKSAIATKVDFSFEESPLWETVYCEAKGVATERWQLLRKLWAHYGPGKLEIWGGSHHRPKITGIVIPEVSA